MPIERNWAGNLEYRAREVHHPTTVEKLRGIVAASRGFRPLGSRHSFSAIADTTGDLIDVTALPRVFELDSDAQTVTVDAGVRYGELAPVLEKHGWALQNMASLPHITVGGSVSTGTHGSGDANPTLSAAVAAIELVTVDGGIERLARGDEGFDGAVVSLGALGVATRYTLDIIPSFGLRQDVYEGLTWDSVLENFDELTAAAYSVSMFTKWTGDEFGTAWLKSTDAEMPEEFGTARRIQKAVGLAEGSSESTTQQGGVWGPWHERLPHFKLEFTPSNGDEIQTEYLVPRAAALEAISLIRELGDQIEPHLHITELREMAADKLWLSGAYDTPAVGIHFTWKKRPDEVNALLPKIEERIIPLGARPHWGKVSLETDLDSVFPRLNDFRALADRFDPRGKLRNEYLDARVFS